ncbi:hypothetical protein Asulf_01006 [Archaeoglobus sulfaticallidus PM70-1]|uniref:Tetratricopeptide repeat protein n=1 Tax=Archaeoglobus sulfaticallidus PM70-1 TaxID=387631 RepID=N0BLF4_9EURY|nr:hypothetical protein [Archaeoglobus sulfaticallidus]AGK61010.1 hypothetical protein Asulf_01006 [Archaeoglobus sulfaticallidus PM70-1]
MNEFLSDCEAFLDHQDIKLLRALSSDEEVVKSIEKVFEAPEYAGKYLVMLKDRPKALYIIAKLSERISRYFDGENRERVFELFLKSLRLISDLKDKSINQSVFFLVKEAIERRIDDGDYETAALLITEFYHFGFKSQLKRILFKVGEITEKGDFERAINILSRLKQNEVIRELKTQIYIEWGRRYMELKDYLAAEIQLKEALNFAENDLDVKEIKMLLYDALKNQNKFEDAMKQLETIDTSSPIEELKVLREKAKLLLSWAEKSKDVDNALEKYDAAYRIAVKIGDSELARKCLEKANVLKK